MVSDQLVMEYTIAAADAYNAVMMVSTVSLACCNLWLILALSYITFFLGMKYA